MSRHVGLRISLDECIHSIKLDSGLKYDRYFAIAFLKSKGDLPPCVAVGSLEVEKKTGGAEYFNPCKFYSLDKMFEAIIHMLASYIAFYAFENSVSPRQVFMKLLDMFRSDYRLLNKLANLAEGYYKKMVEIESSGAGE
jgi:hypothetical protein